MSFERYEAQLANEPKELELVLLQGDLEAHLSSVVEKIGSKIHSALFPLILLSTE